jgi:predicted transcriptional regulator of viral defense system
MNAQSFFDTHPVFRYEEFAQFMKEQRSQQHANCRQQLSYHHKVGNLIHIRKFLYAPKPSSIKKENFWIDPYLLAGKASQDAVLAYHTALELHNLAYTTFEELTFLTVTLSKPFVYGSQRFRSVSFPKSILAKDKKDNNIEIIQRQGINLKITNLERTIVDILDRPDLGGGWEEIWRSLDHLTHFDIKKLVGYTLLLDNATTTAKVGFFLEQRPVYLSVNAHYIKKLLAHIPKQPHYMNRTQRSKGQYIKKWQLIVPTEIIERKWEEPHVPNV